MSLASCQSSAALGVLEMLVGGFSSRQIPASLHSSFVESKAFSRSRTQVRIRFSPPHRIELRLRQPKCLEWGSSGRSRVSVVVRADFLQQELEAHSRSRSETLIQKSGAQRRFRNKTLRQDLQRNPNQQVEAEPKAGFVSDKQRNPRGETLNFDFEKTSGRTISIGSHQEAQSKRFLRAASLTPNVEKKSGPKIAISRGKDAHPSKPRGRKPIVKGFDVLDELISMQDRGSSAFLEKLKMASMNKDDGRVHHDSSVTSMSSGKVITRDFIEQKHSGTAQSLKDGDVERRDTWQPIHGFTTRNEPASSSFASSFKKASSAFTDTKEDSLARPLVSSRHQSPLQQAVSDRQAPPSKTEDVSEVEKPSLRGHEVLWALQKAAMEKAKLKQKNRKSSDRTSKSKEVVSSQELRDWRDAKPIVVRPEWALQIDKLERWIIDLKNPMPSL